MLSRGLDPRHVLGRQAEEDALKWFLENRPSRFLTRNFRCRRGEIDLIFEETKPGTGAIELVFVEVRSRVASRRWMDGLTSLDQAKQRSLRTTANTFLLRYRGPSESVRFDLMDWDGNHWTHVPHMMVC